MKKLSLIIVIAFSMLTTQSIIAQEKNIETNQEELVNASFTVYGNCGMCKKRIESAAMSVEGVEKAQWDEDSKILKVQYSDQVFAKHNNSIDAISEKIAEVGHDTQFHKASDKDYNGLPGCCQYERKEGKDHDGHKN